MSNISPASGPTLFSNQPFLTEDKDHKVLVEWNECAASRETVRGTATAYPHDRTIHQLFERQVDATPDATAVIFNDEQLSYRDLNRRANLLAHHLVAQGVAPDVLVAICLPRSIDMVVAVLGTLKAGGAYLPLEPSLPNERLRYMLEDSEVKLLLTESQVALTLPRVVKRLNLDQKWATWEPNSAPITHHAGVANVKANHLAYCIYTSGSTGKPKGVLVEHKSLVNHCYAIKDAYSLSSRDRVLQFAGVSFDVMAEELFPTWLSGATVVLHPHSLVGWSSWEQWLMQEKITVLNLPAPYWQEWVQELTTLPPDIRLVVAGSDKILPSRLVEWQEKVNTSGHHVEFLHVYGITEDTITTTLYNPAENPESFANSVPIGRPLPNTQLYILDPNQNPVPTLTSGELHIGGAGLARGYLNRPQLTAKKFIPNPFGPGRLYKTGDLCRYIPHCGKDLGNLEFLGRIDHQVKIRGFRIELGEVEAVLTRHPLVREAAVVTHQETNDKLSGEKRLIAYFVPQRQDKPVKLWPSHGDYQIFDDVMYYAMTNDKLRNWHYKMAIGKQVKDKVVVDIGTGKDFIQSRFCLEAGAKRIYAIEAQQEAYQQAKSKVEKLGLQEQIILIHGNSTEVSLPEQVDVCVSELIGTIGSSEGVIPILNDARRFLKPNGVMIPERCLTKIAAVQFPDDFADEPHFSEISGHYGHLIWQKIGYQIDFRVAIQNLPSENVMSSSALFEELDFTAHVAPEEAHSVTLTIEKEGRIDGFLLWLNLHTVSGQIIDTLAEAYSWLPVYWPVFYPGVEVSAGDTITAVCTRLFSADNFNPDYKIKGRLHRQHHEALDFEYDSALYGVKFRSDAFYEKLFAENTIPTKPESRPRLSALELRAYLKEQLPEYMIPTTFVELIKMPRTAGGKIDRRTLTERIHAEDFEPKVGTFMAPRNQSEQQLVQIWQEVLGHHGVGIQDNFFDLGGHSLLALRLMAQIQQDFGVNLPLSTLFQSPTIEELAMRLVQPLSSIKNTDWSALVPIQPNGEQPPFFCVPGVGGNVIYLYDLARFMGAQQPFYGLQAVGLDGKTAPVTTVEAIAAHYIKAIQSVQPEGPYLLGGHSFGGTVIFEMAQQLQRAGHEIARLMIFDMPAPTPRTEFDKATWNDAKWLLSLAKSIGIWTEKQTERIFDTLLRLEPEEQLLRFKEKLEELNLLPINSDLNQVRGWVQVYKTNSLMNYVPRAVIPTPIMLFRAEEQSQSEQTKQQEALFPNDSLTWGWNQFAKGPVEVISVPGDHTTMMRAPHIQVLAKRLRESLLRMS